jgi:hypothetical protein
MRYGNYTKLTEVLVGNLNSTVRPKTLRENVPTFLSCKQETLFFPKDAKKIPEARKCKNVFSLLFPHTFVVRAFLLWP